MYRWTLTDGETSNRLQVCATDLEREVLEVRDWVSQHHMDLDTGKTQLHCIAYYDTKGRDSDYVREVPSKLHQNFDITLGAMWIGRQGIGMEVRLIQEQLNLWKQPSSVTPNVTLVVTRGYQAKDIYP